MVKYNLKRILLLGVPLLLLLGYLIFVFIRIFQEEKGANANGILVTMTNPHFHFVDKKEVLQLAEKQLGSLDKIKHDSINKNTLELAIRKNPFVEGVEVFRTGANGYKIEITQRSPILRVWTDKETYYLDKEGYRMPTGIDYAALVHVYRGAISEAFAKRELISFQKYLNTHPFWSDMVDYVVINSKEELTLYLGIKSGKVYLGKTQNVAEKLEKLLLFIEKVGKHNGLENYASIDLRFDNQVVVKKREDAAK